MRYKKCVPSSRDSRKGFRKKVDALGAGARGVVKHCEAARLSSQ
jgi:hypothetical protein